MWASRRDHSVEGWTSVVFPRDRVEIARVRPRTGDRPAVAAWESFALQGGELDAIKRLRSAKKFGDTRCTTLLQHGDYQILQTEKPDMPQAEMRDAIRWRIKEQVDFPIEQAVIDVLDIPAQPGGRAPQMFVVAAGTDRVAPRIHLFQDAKVDLAAIDIPELALRNIAALFEQEGHGLALLAFDTAGGYLVFTYQGELLAARFIDVRRDDLAAAKPGEGGLYDKVLLDVQRSLDNFERAHSYAPLTRVLVGALPGGNDFIDYLKSNLYQPVEMLDLSSVMDLAAVPTLAEPVRQAEALLAIGAAMRTGAGAQ
jgi:MSHA biogenesis protein MshI